MIEDYFEKLGYKKAAALLVGIGLLIFIVVFVPLLFGWKPKKVDTQNTLKTTTPLSVSAPSVTKSIVHKDVKVYKNNDIQFQYPTEWNITEEQTIAVKGTSIQINTVNEGAFVIDIGSISNSTLRNNENILINQGYKKSTTVVDNISVDMLDITENDGSKKIITFIVKNGKSFIVLYSYPDVYVRGKTTYLTFLKTVHIF